MATTFAHLKDEVAILLQDTSAEIVARIPIALNEALYSVADELISCGGIPDLKAIGTFETVVDQAWTTLPTGFNGKLLFAGNDSTCLAIADGGVAQLMAENPSLDESGPVHTVALEGSVLYYQGIPSSATTYPILYQINPTVWSDDADVVADWVPLHLQRLLFVHKATATLFNWIEDGIDGDQVNTLAQLGLHEKYLTQMREFLARRKTASMRSIWLK
jgi:hypothetical protein